MNPGIIVPPNGYGGHERLVHMFALEYKKLGHEVHLLVTKGSNVPGCTLHSLGKEGFPPKKLVSGLAIAKAWFFLLKNRNKFDLIHNFGRLVYLLPILNNQVKKIMTYGREISSSNIKLINQLPTINLTFTGCSLNLISRVEAGGKWEAVYNSIPFDQYELNSEYRDDNPLVFLGRLERVKGVHLAIEVAKRTKQKLIIAGNISSLYEEKVYFENEIEPHIDNEQVKYIGSVNDKEKNELLRNAKALLFPILWEEPFGMVMTESMACGTPVIGFNRGSVPEVIDIGITGFVVDTLDEMCHEIFEIEHINRKKCRETAQSKFDVPVIANQYLNL
jgi:glycosyltransferase involved in cell wall biosynthesis